MIDEIKIKSLIDGISYVDDVSDNEIRKRYKRQFVPNDKLKSNIRFRIFHNMFPILFMKMVLQIYHSLSLLLHEIAKILLIKKNKSPHYIIFGVY